jgi:hypothetical protein
VLHLLNGDATASIFPDALPGERAVWRDILMEGPADTDLETRAAWLAPRLDVTPEEYLRGWREGQATLARAKEHDEVVLWFERDLFCAINLWFVLSRVDTPRISLVFPGISAEVKGLGMLESAQLRTLYEQRQRLSANEIADARALWDAYAAADPMRLVELEPAFPFAPAAIRLHCGRFPSVAHGLDEVEHATLERLNAPADFAALFSAFTSSAPLNELGIGDVQFAATLRDLAAGPAPLVTIEHRDQPSARWRISRTPATAEVLAGRIDRLALSPLDRWLGGVHLRPGAPLWRWDADRQTLVSV